MTGDLRTRALVETLADHQRVKAYVCSCGWWSAVQGPLDLEKHQAAELARVLDADPDTPTAPDSAMPGADSPSPLATARNTAAGTVERGGEPSSRPDIADHLKAQMLRGTVLSDDPPEICPKCGRPAADADVAIALPDSPTAEQPRVREVWFEGVRNDGTHEYTDSSDCDGSHRACWRRLPALHAEPTRWEEVDSIPADATYPEAEDVPF